MDAHRYEIFQDVAGLNGLAAASEYAIRHNAQVKVYPDGACAVMVADRSIFRERGWQSREGKPKAEAEGETDHAANISRAQRRARAAAFDIARSSDFDLFVTLTVDAAKLDRYNADEVFRHLHDWLDNRVRRNGLRYLLVPEYHKDGAIHFHALFNECLEMVDSGTISIGGRPRKPRSKAQRDSWLRDGGHIVYNLPAWGWGFTTAIRMYGSLESAAGYVVKYITKSEQKIGGRWYYSGGELKRPEVLCADIPYQSIEREGFEIEELGCHCKKVLMSGEEFDARFMAIR